MNFFQRIGNFFTGAGWVDDDEKKRKQQAEANRRAQQASKQAAAGAQQRLAPPKQKQAPQQLQPVLNANKVLKPTQPALQPSLNARASVKPPVNILEATRDLVNDTVVKPITNSAESLGKGLAFATGETDKQLRAAVKQENDATAQFSQLYKQGKISKVQYQKFLQEGAQRLNQISRQAAEQTRETDPTRQAGNVINLALTAGGVGNVPSLVGRFASRGIRGAVARNAAEGAAFGLAGGAASAMQEKGSQVNAGDIAMGAGTGAGLGAGAGALIPLAGRGVQKFLQSGKTPKLSSMGGNRPGNTEQLKIEEFLNKGDTQAAQKVVDAIKDPDLRQGMQQTINQITGNNSMVPTLDPVTKKIVLRPRNMIENMVDKAGERRTPDAPSFIKRESEQAPRVETETPRMNADKILDIEELKPIVSREQYNQRRAELQREYEAELQANPNERAVIDAAYGKRISELDDVQKKAEKLYNTLADSQQATTKAAGEQMEVVANKVDEASQAAADTQAARAVDAAPINQVTPEVQANDAYAPLPSSGELSDQLLKERGIDLEGSEPKVRAQNRLIKSMVEKVTGGRSDVSTLGELYKQGVVDPLSSAAGGVLRRGIESENRITSAVSQLPRMIWARAGRSEGQRRALREVSGLKSAASEATRVIARDIKTKIEALGDKEVRAAVDERITRFFESPDFLVRKYGDDAKVSIEQLSPTEREIVSDLINLNKLRNKVNYETGLINAEQYAAFADGMHSPRVYDINSGAPNAKRSNPNTLDETAGVQRKDLADIDDAVFNKVISTPQAMIYRLESALRNKAQLDSVSNLDRQGLIYETAPNKGFSQLKGKQWGEYNGKWVDNQVYTELTGKQKFNSAAGQATNNLLDTYRSSFLGKLDRGQKQIKTVFSPATFLGNVFSNPIAFNRGAGVNALSQSAQMVKATSDLLGHRVGNKFNPQIYELERAGIFGGNTARAMTGEVVPEETVLRGDRWKKNPIEAFKNIYGGVDDAAKLAIYQQLLRKGLSKQKAMERVSQFSQDYANAGRLIQTLADAPVLGKPFARFVPELLRITKNNVIYNPLGTVAGIAAFAIVKNELSKSAGETEEERDARENGVGQTKLPGTAWIDKLIGGSGRDISLNLPINGTATNIARLTGLNFPMEPNGDANTALIKQLMPFVIPTRQNAQDETVFSPSELISSLALSPIVDQIMDRDFMGRKISDPENKTIYENGNMVVEKLSGEQKPGDEAANRIRSLAMAYLPYSSEADAMGNALAGQKDYYGKERTVPQALLRMVGLKTEDNSPEARQQRVESAQYFDEKLPAVQQFLRENPDLAGAYFTINNPTRDRNTNIKESEIITPEKWDVINSETSGRLFNFLKGQALGNNRTDGKPVDPIFQLDEQRARYVAELRSRPTGDDIEAEEILRATQPWYRDFEDAEGAFYDQQSKFYEANPISGGAKDSQRVVDYREASKPVRQPEVVQQYYQLKSQDTDAAKSFYKANAGMLSDAFAQYSAQRLGRINAMRRIEGYDPIDPEVFANKTFGFDMKESSGGSGGGRRGYGRGRGGGGGGDEQDFSNILNRLTNEAGEQETLAPITPEQMPALMGMLQKLMAKRTSRSKPKLGAASRGQG